MRTQLPTPLQRKDSFPWNTLSRTSSFSANAAAATTPTTTTNNSNSNNNTTLPSEEAMQSRKPQNSPPTFTTDRVDRTSFSSVKETNTGIAQSFTDSKTSSYLRNVISANGGDAAHDEAIYEDSLSSGSITPLDSDKDSGIEIDRKFGGLTASRLKGFVCPCDGFRGWKGISVKGKIASKSYGDLQALGNWNWEVKEDEKEEERAKGVEEEVESGKDEAGNSPLERLPVELLGSIIDKLATDIPPNGFSARNIDLMALLQTSRTIHAATLSTLYGNITIPHSRIFRKFLTHIAAYPALGTIVRRIDFSHFNPTGAGMTARQRAETPYLLPQTLLQCLNLTPNLQEFLAQEHIDDELSVEVLNALFEMPKIKALDFCACSSTGFKNAFEAALSGPLPIALPIARLSLHECTAVSASAYTSLLPRLTQLTHLDVAHTRITDEALFAIPRTAKLTHLNISRCAGLTGEGVVKFLTTHPAVKELVYLNLACDVKSHELLTAEDITVLLPRLPTTLRSLNLKGSKMDSSHINLVIPLTKHVEELGLGRHLKLKDLTRLFLPSAPLDTPAEDLEEAEIQAQLEWTPHSLRYIDVSDLNSSELDLSTLFASSCPLLTSTSHPLEVLELSAEVYKKLENSPSSLKRVGWCVKEAGRRGWLVRVKTPRVGEKVDDGSRSWKWGAQFWGGRKIPVARAEVGGMYGHYMFKR